MSRWRSLREKDEYDEAVNAARERAVEAVVEYETARRWIGEGGGVLAQVRCDSAWAQIVEAGGDLLNLRERINQGNTMENDQPAASAARVEREK